MINRSVRIVDKKSGEECGTVTFKNLPIDGHYIRLDCVDVLLKVTEMRIVHEEETDGRFKKKSVKLLWEKEIVLKHFDYSKP